MAKSVSKHFAVPPPSCQQPPSQHCPSNSLLGDNSGAALQKLDRVIMMSALVMVMLTFIGLLPPRSIASLAMFFLSPKHLRGGLKDIWVFGVQSRLGICSPRFCYSVHFSRARLYLLFP